MTGTFIEFEMYPHGLVRLLDTAIVAVEDSPHDGYMVVRAAGGSWTVKGTPDTLFRSMAGVYDDPTFTGLHGGDA